MASLGFRSTRLCLIVLAAVGRQAPPLLAMAEAAEPAADAEQGAPALSLDVDRSTGRFSIALGGEVWFAGGDYRLGSLSAASGSLVLSGSVSTAGGSDALGQYKATTLKWCRRSLGRVVVHDEERTLFETSFREYVHHPEVLVFEQNFPKGLDLRELGPSEQSSTLFPSFSQVGPTGIDLPCFAFHGLFGSLRACNVSSYNPGDDQATPLVIYDIPARGRVLPMAVLSPLTNFMGSAMVRSGPLIGVGLPQAVEVVPTGWSQFFILSTGSGINSGMMSWGDYMLRFHGQTRADNRYRDDVHGGIGFWTDNGGYYHYSIGGNRSEGSNYEEVLPKVKAYHDSLGVPFRHWQFDSWFYPKDGPVEKGGGGPALLNWTALASVFPSGMAYIQSKIRMPMVMHNRWFSPKTDYIKMWPEIDWYISPGAALPKDPTKFFDIFFQQQKGWGLSMYEQDWMITQYNRLEALHTNLTLGDMWLRGMAIGARRANLTIQYCMPLPNQILTSVALPEVTNIRASGDYHAGSQQWSIGNTAMLLWALNKLPFKDGFYSSSRRQPGGEDEDAETDPDREAIIATLSAAMVGPMDGIRLLNLSRVMATCRGDGMVLKPDRPLTTPDACFRRRDPYCGVVHTYSEVPGLGRVHYYFRNGSAPIHADEFGVSALTEGEEGFAAFNWYHRSVVPLPNEGGVRLAPGYEGHVYAIAAPIRRGWIFVGEINKYATASTLRFRSVVIEEVDGNGAAGGVDRGATLTAEVVGTAKELVEVCVARVQDWELHCQKLHFAEAGLQRVTFQETNAAELQLMV